MKPVLWNDLDHVGKKEADTVHVLLDNGGQIVTPFAERKGQSFNVKENDIADIATDEETKRFIEFEKGFVQVRFGRRRGRLSRSSANQGSYSDYRQGC
jgi:hypothetical protein